MGKDDLLYHITSDNGAVENPVPELVEKVLTTIKETSRINKRLELIRAISPDLIVGEYNINRKKGYNNSHIADCYMGYIILSSKRSLPGKPFDEFVYFVRIPSCAELRNKKIQRIKICQNQK
tara:strand:- start:1080 stop:1445 length:366 start_codon:yes stop_codon:yes gene_type:complete